MANAHIITQDAITIVTDRPHTFERAAVTETVMTEVAQALNDGDYDAALDLLTPKKAIEQFFDGEGDVRIDGGVVLYKGQPVDNYATQRAVDFARQGLPYKPLLRFIDKVQQNPSYRAVTELYRFLEAGNLPLTNDGDFLAYKKVRRDRDGQLVDIHSGTFSNEPGAVCEMPRNQVDEDPDRTCSSGLHVCSHSYLPHFGNGGDSAIVTVKVNPADVVAVPRDYNNAKMRVCRYEVLNILEEYEPRDGNYFDTDLYDEDYDEDEDENEDEDEDGFWIENDWSGSDMTPPAGVDPDCNVEVQFRLGESRQGQAGSFDWDNDGSDYDVLRYRFV